MSSVHRVQRAQLRARGVLDHTVRQRPPDRWRARHTHASDAEGHHGNIVLTEPDAATGTRTRVLWEGDETASTAEQDRPVFDFADATYALSASGKPVAFD